MEINFGKWNGGKEGRVSSIGYMSESDWAIWCESEDDRYEVDAVRAAKRTCNKDNVSYSIGAKRTHIDTFGIL